MTWYWPPIGWRLGAAASDNEWRDSDPAEFVWAELALIQSFKEIIETPSTRGETIQIFQDIWPYRLAAGTFITLKPKITLNVYCSAFVSRISSSLIGPTALTWLLPILPLVHISVSSRSLQIRFFLYQLPLTEAASRSCPKVPQALKYFCSEFEIFSEIWIIFLPSQSLPTRYITDHSSHSCHATSNIPLHSLHRVLVGSVPGEFGQRVC